MDNLKNEKPNIKCKFTRSLLGKHEYTKNFILIKSQHEEVRIDCKDENLEKRVMDYIDKYKEDGIKFKIKKVMESSTLLLEDTDC